MAFDPVEYLKEGKADFIFSLSPSGQTLLTKWVRENENKLETIADFLCLLKDEVPFFCFEVIYDIEECRETTLYLMEKYKECTLNAEKIKNVLEHTTWGRDYILNHLDEMTKEEEIYKLILEFIFDNFEKNMDFIKKLSLHQNLHVRFFFMKKLVEERYDKIGEVYDDILKYLTSYTYQEQEQMTLCPELMDVEDISSLAIAILHNTQDRKMWERIKKYILDTYTGNDLGKILLESDRKGIEFKKDADLYFETSRNYQFFIFNNYSNLISKEIIEAFAKKIKYFQRDGQYDQYLDRIYHYELGKKLEKYVEKYLDLSKEKTTSYILSGTTSSCYRIGDYAIKLSHMKWSYEDVICPNLYLIHKNLEEDFVRDEEGYVLAGLEVESYLRRKANHVPKKIFSLWKEELNRLGYYLNDDLIGGRCGDNCRLLNSYKDADYHNPEDLPDWFKEYPLVLVNRDRVYQLENKHPKQIHIKY